MIRNTKRWAQDLTRGQAALDARRADRSDVEAEAESRFKSVARRAALYQFPDALYVSSHKEQPKPTCMKWMTLHSGTRAIGTGIDGGLLTEGGCALHLAQDVTGEVWTVLYPFRSEMRAQREEYLVVDRTRPSKLTAGRLDRRLRQFMSYSRVTTVGHCASRRDKAVVWWARARNHYAGRSFLATIGGLVLDGLRRIPVLGKFLPRVANRLHLLDEDGQGAE